MPVHLPTLKTATMRREQALEALDMLTDTNITTLLRRARYPAVDAYSRPGEGGGGGNTISKPTEAALIRDAGGKITRDEDGHEHETADTWPTAPDPVRANIEEAFTVQKRMAKDGRRLKELLVALNLTHEQATTKPVNHQGYCQRCGRAVAADGKDKIIAGYCKVPCHNRWVYLGKPDRIIFVNRYKADVAAGVDPDGHVDWDSWKATQAATPAPAAAQARS